MMRRQKLGPVPLDTAEAAKKCFRRKPNIYVMFADLFNEQFDVEEFADSFSSLGQSAIHPLRLLLLLTVEYLEGLSDRQVMDALAARIDLKYLLSLPLDHEGYDHTVLSEMRLRLINGGLETLLLDKMLTFAENNGLLDTSKQRTDSTVILSAAKRLSRLELIIETLAHTLDVLSDVVPNLVLSAAAKFEELRAYEVSTFQYRLPKTENKQQELAAKIGRDGVTLMTLIDASSEREVLNKIEAVKTLRQIWSQEFDLHDGRPRWKKQKELKPAAELIGSPHDPDARFTSKRNETQFGFKVHVTETCGPGMPRLITNVLTEPATTSDSASFAKIQKSVRERGFQPIEHLVDAGYTKASEMFNSLEQFGVEIVGPLRGGNSWQSQANEGFDTKFFAVDYENKTARCPQGELSTGWRERPKRGSIEVAFAKETCDSCPVRFACTKATRTGRKLELKTKEVQQFMSSIREYQRTSEFAKQYAPRAGVEGTMSRLKAKDDGRSPYMGSEKTHLKNALACGAINAMRLIRWVLRIKPETTRRRRFPRLLAATAA